MPQCRFLLTLICVDVAEKVGMTTNEILRATATTLFQFHSRGNTAVYSICCFLGTYNPPIITHAQESVLTTSFSPNLIFFIQFCLVGIGSRYLTIQISAGFTSSTNYHSGTGVQIIVYTPHLGCWSTHSETLILYM